MSFDKIIEYLNGIPQFIDIPGFSYGYDRALYVLDKMGHPEQQLKIVHVAGTNGKGSVCGYLSEALQSLGVNTGLFTSPHLTDPGERIRFNGEMIAINDFTRLFLKVDQILSNIKKEINNFQISYFEYFLLIAILWFIEKNADMVIIETGLGGRLDSTNALSGVVMSVITSISLEHTAILGDTVEKIAFEKAGIIKTNTPVVVNTPKEKEVKDVIIRKAKECGSPVYYAGGEEIKKVSCNDTNIDFYIENEYYRNVKFNLPAPAFYEAVNASVALKALALLRTEGIVKGRGNCLSKEEIITVKDALSKRIIEGRMQLVSGGVWVDGAHNPGGMEAFLKSASSILGEKKGTLLFSAVDDKNIDDEIRMICSSRLFETVVIAGLKTERFSGGEKIRDIFLKQTDGRIFIFDNVPEAYEYALKIKKEYLFCTGSLYLIGEIRSVLKDQ